MKPIVLKRVFALLLLVICAIPVRACLWDNDTLEAEAKGIPDTIAVITGRFERNPDLFYEMRLARVEKELQSTPAKLELYDDAGVACDRLHQGDEAIAWMERKRTQMEKLRATAGAGVLREHRYRTLANEGTFIAHRWLRSGADRKKISEMKRARDLIQAAIKLNPDAHFGREKYQLKAMEWIINPPKWKHDYDPPDILGLHSHLDPFEKKEVLTKLGYSNAIQGLTGLIALGDAWESVDVLYTLKLALMVHQDTSIAYFAEFRRSELIEDGRRSLHPDAAKPQNQAPVVARDWLAPIDFWNTPRDFKPDDLKKLYQNLRAEADQWHAQRTTYMMERLEAGRHPDTDKNFWNEWQETPVPSLHVPSLQEKRARRQQYLNIGMVVFSVLFVSLFALRIARKHRKAGD